MPVVEFPPIEVPGAVVPPVGAPMPVVPVVVPPMPGFEVPGVEVPGVDVPEFTGLPLLKPVALRVPLASAPAGAVPVVPVVAPVCVPVAAPVVAPPGTVLPAAIVPGWPRVPCAPVPEAPIRERPSSCDEPLPAPAGGIVTGAPNPLVALPSPPSGAVRPLVLPLVFEVLEGDWKAK